MWLPEFQAVVDRAGARLDESPLELRIDDPQSGRIVGEVLLISGPLRSRKRLHNTGIPNRRTSPSNSRRRNGNDGAMKKSFCICDGS